MRRALPALWVALLWAPMGCTSPKARPEVGPPAPRVLTEAQALAAIQEALVRAKVLAERSLPVHVGPADAAAELDADVHFAKPPFAIEWVNAEERAKYGELLPAGSATSPLRIVSARSAEGPVQVLILDFRAYAYEGNPLLVQRGAPGVEEAEQRLRRDVNDFVEYVRDQGAAL